MMDPRWMGHVEHVRIEKNAHTLSSENKERKMSGVDWNIMLKLFTERMTLRTAFMYPTRVFNIIRGVFVHVVFWVVTSCRLVGGYRCVARQCCFCLQGL